MAYDGSSLKQSRRTEESVLKLDATSGVSEARMLQYTQLFSEHSSATICLKGLEKELEQAESRQTW